MRHIVHGKRRLIHAVLYALGENAGCSAVSDGKTVGEQNDHVLGGGFLRRRVKIPICAHFTFGRLHDNGVLAGLLDFDVTHDECGAFGIDFFGNPDFRTLEHFLIVGAVDFDDDVLAVGLLVKFNLEVEFGIGHETCLIDRIDLRGRDRCGSECTENADGSQCGGCGAQYEFLHGDVVFLWGRKLARESASSNKWTNGGRERWGFLSAAAEQSRKYM